MTIDELANHIDLSLLKPDATIKDMDALIMDAKKYPFASVCIPPCHVRLASMMLGDASVKVSTVIGFPFGYQSMDLKIHEACDAVEAGVDEVDMVMNISMFKSGELAYVQDEISKIVSAIHGITLKVIIEACYLTNEEKVKACELVAKGKADYVKTSTGFGPGGATVSDVKLLAETASGRIKVKASGGIKSLDDAIKMIEAGALRIGTSAGAKMLEELKRGPLQN